MKTKGAASRALRFQFHFQGDGRIWTADQGFADPCLNHLATSPQS